MCSLKRASNLYGRASPDADRLRPSGDIDIGKARVGQAVGQCPRLIGLAVDETYLAGPFSQGAQVREEIVAVCPRREAVDLYDLDPLVPLAAVEADARRAFEPLAS